MLNLSFQPESASQTQIPKPRWMRSCRCGRYSTSKLLLCPTCNTWTVFLFVVLFWAAATGFTFSFLESTHDTLETTEGQHSAVSSLSVPVGEIIAIDDEDDVCADTPTLEAMISIWVDHSGSVKGVVPELTFDHLRPILSVVSQLDAASVSVGIIGSYTRQEMAFLTFNTQATMRPPQRKHGERPLDYQERLRAYKKKLARKTHSSTYEQKIDQFTQDCNRILNMPRNHSSSLICEAVNVSKRQLEQVNVSQTTPKFVLFISDMLHNGAESCPTNLGDADVVIVNRLSYPDDLMSRSNTHHFISIEEAVDYIANNI